jgi:hypothetical protein
MNDGISVNRVRIQPLPDNPAGLAVLRSSSQKRDPRTSQQISGKTVPDKVQRILVLPHVLAAGIDLVLFLGRIEPDRPFVPNITDIGLGFELAQLGLLGRTGYRQCQKDRQSRASLKVPSVKT